MTIRTFSIACIMGICHAVPANGQHAQTYQATMFHSEARFEILQSESGPRWTFRLDRFTGRIHELIESPNRPYVWQEMEVPDRPETSIPSRPRFQLFSSSSSITGRHTFLLDTDTGSTWILTSEGRGSRGGFTQVWTLLP